jgi:hypothetical protein
MPKERKEGYDAFLAGKTLLDDPYPEGTAAFDMWALGWLDAQDFYVADDEFYP